MNVLHLSAVKSRGGGGNHIENLCYELSKTNPEITSTIVVAKGGLYEEHLKTTSFNYRTLPMPFKVNPAAIFKIIRICMKEKIDIIHIHGATSLTLAVIANNFYPLPLFVLSKKTSFPIKKRKQTLYKYNHPKIKKILCVSEKTSEITAEAITDHSKIRTIYHGTRMDNKSTETPFLLKEKCAFPEGTKIIGTIGNHIPAKDLMTWIRTIDFLVNQKKVSNLRFVQIGAFSELTAELKKEIESRKLEKYVAILGYQPNASNFMHQFEVLLMTSKSEGIPQVIYEAFYHGTPVISTTAGGISEIIEHRKNGLLAAPTDYKSLGEGVLELVENEELSRNMTQENKAKLVPIFTSEHMAQETLKVYREILNDQQA